MPTDFDVPKTDRSFAARFFNDTWGYLDKTSRTEDETDAMIHCCHASFHHWSRLADATRTNIAVGYWQLARVYAVAGKGPEAQKYARLCLKSAGAPNAEQWVMGSAHEAMARAAAVRGDRSAREEHIAAARVVAENVKDEETRATLMGDIESVP